MLNAGTRTYLGLALNALFAAQRRFVSLLLFPGRRIRWALDPIARLQRQVDAGGYSLRLRHGGRTRAPNLQCAVAPQQLRLLWLSGAVSRAAHGSETNAPFGGNCRT